MSDLLLVGSRAVHLAAGALLVAAVAFRWLVLRPARVGDSAAAAPALARFKATSDHLVLGCGVVLVLSGLGNLAAVAASMSGQALGKSLTLDTWRTVLLQTHYGAVTLLRAVLVAALIAAAIARFQRPWWVLDFAVGVIAVAVDVSFAWTGHAAAVGHATGNFHVAIDATHLLLVAIWPGMLVPFALFLRLTPRDAALLPLVRRVTMRFAQVSLVAVLLLATSGTANATFMLRRPGDLVFTTYGEILSVKIALFLAVLAVAIFIRRRLLPGLLGSASDVPQTRGWLGRLCALVLVEIAFAAVILTVTAVLGITPPR